MLNKKSILRIRYKKEKKNKKSASLVVCKKVKENEKKEKQAKYVEQEINVAYQVLKKVRLPPASAPTSTSLLVTDRNFNFVIRS